MADSTFLPIVVVADLHTYFTGASRIGAEPYLPADEVIFTPAVRLTVLIDITDTELACRLLCS